MAPEPVKCPACPMCGAAPLYVHPALAQAVCPSDDCAVFLWDLYVSAKENLDDAHAVDVAEVFLTDE